MSPLTIPAEADGYRAHCRRRLLQRYVPAIPLGVGFNVALAALCLREGQGRHAAVLTAIGSGFALSYPIARTRFARSRPEAIILAVAALCAGGAATVSAVGPSFDATGWSILLVCWGMGATQLPLLTRAVAFGIVMQLAIFVLVRHMLDVPISVTPWIVNVLVVCGAALACEGSRRHHERGEALFSEEARLRQDEDELRRGERQLEARGLDLEKTASKQVEALLEGAQGIEALELLLSERVRARSRRLAGEVDRISTEPGSSELRAADAPESGDRNEPAGAVG